MAKEHWRFYVYEVLAEDGRVIYIAKGSGYRASLSLKERGGSSVREVARFKRESYAYDFERDRIDAMRPELNRCKGGAGGKYGRSGAPSWVKEMALVGPRVYAARVWLSFYEGCKASGVVFPGDGSKVEAIRQAAYG